MNVEIQAILVEMREATTTSHRNPFSSFYTKGGLWQWCSANFDQSVASLPSHFLRSGGLDSNQRPRASNITTIALCHVLPYFYLHWIYVCYNSTDTSSMNITCRIFVIYEKLGKLSQIDNQAFKGQDCQARQEQRPWL